VSSNGQAFLKAEGRKSELCEFWNQLLARSRIFSTLQWESMSGSLNLQQHRIVLPIQDQVARFDL
jgi:hypothetical protein